MNLRPPGYEPDEPMFIVVKNGEVAKKSIGLLSKEELLDLLK